MNSIKTLLNVFILKRGTEEVLADICKSREKENRFKWADIRREKIVLNEHTSAGNEKREDRFKWADMWIEREEEGMRKERKSF